MSFPRAMALPSSALLLPACTPPEGTREESGIALTCERARVFVPGQLVGKSPQHPSGDMRNAYIHEALASRLQNLYSAPPELVEGKVCLPKWS